MPVEAWFAIDPRIGVGEGDEMWEDLDPWDDARDGKDCHRGEHKEQGQQTKQDPFRDTAKRLLPPVRAARWRSVLSLLAGAPLHDSNVGHGSIRTHAREPGICRAPSRPARWT